jgi:hypothetical protein
VLSQPLPPQITAFWRWYEAMSEANQLTIEDYSKPHVIEKKNSPRAASYASW